MPLCDPCHDKIHNSKFELEEQWEWVARTMATFLASISGEIKDDAVDEL
jgi:hypothetical protein